MQRYQWTDLSPSQKLAALARPEGLSDAQISARVQDIVQAVRQDGDAAVLRLTRQYDAPQLSQLSVSLEDCQAAWAALPRAQQLALETAKANIERFHQAQMPSDITVETQKGVTCQRLPRALGSAGLYVPGGSAPLVSTLLMLAIPAAIAGVQRRVVTTPPGKDGRIDPAILAAAYLCEVTDVFACGGAQAIAAMAFGTQTIPKCAKVFGPGNAYVASAKSYVSQMPGGPAIDLPAGPSEAMVVADQTCDPGFVASDLLSQAEHDVLAQVICVASDKNIADAVDQEIRAQILGLSRRDIAEGAMASSRMIIAPERTDWLDIINAYAPEHLLLQCAQAETLVPAIQNAGSIFLGPWTPESVGDYASGTNHTLPTYGAARSYSGVTLESFFKYISVQSLTPDGLATLGPAVMTLARMEGLDAHERAVARRLERLNS